VNRVPLVLIFVVTLSGCAVSATAPSFSEAPSPQVGNGKAVLYVYREYAEPTAWTAFLNQEDKELVSLPQKGFTWVYINPGKHRFTFGWPLLASMPKVDFEREFEPNKVYVFEMKGRAALAGMSGGAMYFKTESALLPVELNTATATMAKCCRYVAPAGQNE
jgi:hypothetical protein